MSNPVLHVVAEAGAEKGASVWLRVTLSSLCPMSRNRRRSSSLLPVICLQHTPRQRGDWDLTYEEFLVLLFQRYPSHLGHAVCREV